MLEQNVLSTPAPADVDRQPQCLRPYDKRLAMSLEEAATRPLKPVSLATVRGWIRNFGIGRSIGPRRKEVDRVAFEMFLNDDGRALNKYLSGDRSEVVQRYFVQLGLEALLPDGRR